uniref:Sugar fermentation stimulation protein homolog n=2 Tax=Thermoplasma volcanium TaxID=50339 RepID=SFSA_THEVO|nr:RecName: Full=Sugar fermentation stimulation protein homolog [Thermoplasma volcanium GSS1]
MEFTDLLPCTVVERVNRFLVNVKLNDKIVEAHLHDPGRLKEIIYTGNKVLVRRKSGKKTGYRITFGLREDQYILIDSGLHSQIASHFVSQECKPEVKIDDRRLDFACNDIFIEVKGCTLSIDGVAIFPDAPTLRGYEHLRLLERLAQEGKGAYVLFLIFSDATSFRPNSETDPRFSDEFYKALKNGVKFSFKRFSFDGKYLKYSGDILTFDGDDKS